MCGYGNLVYHRLCNRSGTDRILHVGADSGKAYDTKASSLDGNGSRRLSDSFDSLLYRCKDVLQEKTQSCQAACEKYYRDLSRLEKINMKEKK